MNTRNRHPDKEIEAAIKWAESQGWRYKETGKSAHAWGRLLCPSAERAGCALSVWSTPRDSEIHARQIKHRVKKCQHQQLEILDLL